MNNGTFATELKRLRTDRGISQSRLSERVDSQPSYISRLEAGTRQPSREMVDRIVTALALEPEERMALLSAAFLPPDLVAVPVSTSEVIP